MWQHCGHVQNREHEAGVHGSSQQGAEYISGVSLLVTCSRFTRRRRWWILFSSHSCPAWCLTAGATSCVTMVCDWLCHSYMSQVHRGLFGLGRRRLQERRPAPSSKRAAKRPRCPPRATGVAVVGNEDVISGESLFNAPQEDDHEPLPTNFTFNWAAYRAHFGDTPMQDAVTAMFAEYAVLYSRIAGWITSTSSKPMTLSEADDIRQHAEDFVLKFVTPVLGVVQTPKIHKLLRHVFDAIKLHGILQNGNTGGNEAVHKLDKPSYRRTNKTLADFTHQTVRQAQGSRAVLKRNASKDSIAASSSRPAAPGSAVPGSGCPAGAHTTVGQDAVPGGGLSPGQGGAPRAHATVGPAAVSRGSAATVPGGEARGGAGSALRNASGRADASRRVSGARAGGAASGARHGPAPDSSVAAGPPGRPRLQRRVFRTRMTVGVVARRPGLSTLPLLLKRSPADKLRVVNAVYIAARLDCGAQMRQLLRAASSFRHKPWYDAVLYDGDRAHEMLVGEVRAIIRERGQEVAIICNWEPAASPPGCPLAKRAFTPLKWATLGTAEEGDWCLRAVSVRRIRRVVHVVPDFSALVRARGVEATPPGHRADLGELRAMRYFVNDFYPWG